MSDDIVDQSWRTKMLSDAMSGDASRSTRALLALTYNDPDRVWLENFLLDQLRTGGDPQLRALAVTCLGHVGRLRGLVSAQVVRRLKGLLADPVLGGIAEDALGDIEYFAKTI